ncbi:MAG: glycosyltransferase family 1 protein [Variovorax sp.]
MASTACWRSRRSSNADFRAWAARFASSCRRSACCGCRPPHAGGNGSVTWTSSSCSFRRSLHARWADVVHICDHSNAMYVRWVRGKPNLITCHDVIAVQAARGLVDGWNVGRSGRLFQRLISGGLGRADLVVCVSGLTRRALLALRLADESRVAMVLNGLNDDFRPVAAASAEAAIERFGLSASDRYLIHVGLDLPRKNRRAVVEAFIALQRRAAARGACAVLQKLVFVGPPLTPEIVALARRHRVADSITTVQDVSHDELRALYASATALLFPSLQEGFGWPVIEAQACGCPVFTSDLAPMNEIAGTAARYVDPHDPESIAGVIEESAGRLNEMRLQGLENAALFTAERMLVNYVAMYARVLALRRVSPRTQ